MWYAHSGAASSKPKKRRKRKHQETETCRDGHHGVKEHRALFYMHAVKIIRKDVDSAYLSCVSYCVSVHAWESKLCQGIDLATPISQRDTADDLDHIMMDAMLEGFDTGVSCSYFTYVNNAFCSVPKKMLKWI